MHGTHDFWANLMETLLQWDGYKGHLPLQTIAMAPLHSRYKPIRLQNPCVYSSRWQLLMLWHLIGVESPATIILNATFGRLQRYCYLNWINDSITHTTLYHVCLLLKHQAANIKCNNFFYNIYNIRVQMGWVNMIYGKYTLLGMGDE